MVVVVVVVVGGVGWWWVLRVVVVVVEVVLVAGVVPGVLLLRLRLLQTTLLLGSRTVRGSFPSWAPYSIVVVCRCCLTPPCRYIGGRGLSSGIVFLRTLSTAANSSQQGSTKQPVRSVQQPAPCFFVSRGVGGG